MRQTIDKLIILVYILFIIALTIHIVQYAVGRQGTAVK